MVAIPRGPHGVIALIQEVVEEVTDTRLDAVPILHPHMVEPIVTV